MRLPHDTRKSGFTLFELSIALLIIGLLSAGILIGKHLIHAAKVRAQIKQVEQYSLAYNVFRNKYGCIPGDCAKGAQFGLGSSGNGNGFLENSYIYPGPGAFYNGGLDRSSDGYLDFEQAGFFNHLKVAGLIPVDISLVARGYPEAKLAPGKGFVAASDYDPVIKTVPDAFTIQSKSYLGEGQWQVALYFSIGWPDAPDTSWAPDATEREWVNDQHGLFTPVDMFSMDSKIDDGNPQTGKLLAATVSWTSQGGGDDGYCLDNTPHSNTIYTNVQNAFPNAKWDKYLLTNPKTPCIFAFRLQ